MKKLVRDKIVDIMIKNNQNPNFYISENDSEFYSFLKEKLNEEITEFLNAENTEEEISEMGDILEVLDAICEFKKLDCKTIKDKKELKKNERGGFNKRLILIK